MRDRFRFRAYDPLKKQYFYDVQDMYDDEIECFGYMVDDIYKNGYIVEQCTGLRDKNGKLIYEGDIVEVSEAYENGIYKVEFCQEDCEYNLYNEDGNFIYQLTENMANFIKVIGNILENQELLEGSDE